MRWVNFQREKWVSFQRELIDIKKLNNNRTEIQDEVLQLKDKMNAQQANIDALNHHIKTLEQNRTYIPLYVEILDLINEAKNLGTEKIIMETFIHKVLNKHLKAGDNEYLNIKLIEHKSYSKLSNNFRLAFKGYRDREGIVI